MIVSPNTHLPYYVREDEFACKYSSPTRIPENVSVGLRSFNSNAHFAILFYKLLDNARIYVV
jgi:hypothetical protein